VRLDLLLGALISCGVVAERGDEELRFFAVVCTSHSKKGFVLFLDRDDEAVI